MLSKNIKENNELSDNELSDNEISDNRLSDNELSDNELSYNQISDNEISDNKISDNKISEYTKYNNSYKIDNYYNKIKLKKISRTILIKSENYLDSNLFNKYEGIMKVYPTKNNKLLFLTFDTIDNSLNTFKLLKKNKDLYIKFSYYKIFFTINGLNNTTNYNEIKKDLINYLTDKVNNINILYCKFYYKNNKYLGCGDFTIDTLESLINILSKEQQNKEFSFKSYSGIFYKFTEKKIY